MRRSWSSCGLLVFLFCAGSRLANAQTNESPGQSISTYGLRVSVDEVGVTFHAADAHGLPINDLKLDEMKLFDNGATPRKILAFYSMQDFPIRAGILVDTSESMVGDLARDRAIAIEYAQKLLRRNSDQAFVMDFGYVSNITQPWTGDPAALTAGIRRVTAGKQNPLGGTAMFDTIFRACFNQFGKIDPAASGNFILLFSDGEDNVSHSSLKEVVDICQRSNTAIFAFRAAAHAESFSTGPKTLAELAAQTGGRVFNDDDSETEIDNDLRIIEADLRNQYRLVYKPKELKHDGSFHRIEFYGSDRVGSIVSRTGYYAPTH